ncbi:arginine--tRNA ligase [Candidatus Haliotispira prima]|uniref:Arginine--tRNA ligase n=1 Tax=Candidatus Haliotispira prima TaxID=3034016 RepID=A0ABY8MH87_9SPIO|nr:arginine--tRNA ligase [Candidatus Haliotispira prima]
MNEQQFIQNALQKSIEQELIARRLELGETRPGQLGEQLCPEKPPKAELGDWACPCFPLAKIFREAPPKLAVALAERLRTELPGWEIEPIGAYLNFRLPRDVVARSVMEQIALEQADFGRNEELKGRKVMIEFSSPNTNKPLHLGHLRNNVLGESISRIVAAGGAELNKVNIINDRGVHICKSMLAYQHFGRKEGPEGPFWETPESRGCKGDRLVGDYYVRFNDWVKEGGKSEEAENPEQLALKMLKEWEDGRPEVRELWQKMRKWVLDGIAQTYIRCGISFDRLYFESETYKLGQELVAEGLERGIFQRREDGAIFIDLSDCKLDQKVVQRSDGTSVYITQDLGTAVARHRDFPFDCQIYVVGNEQDYHFKVLFRILHLFGYPWSEQLQHLSYGMVVLPEGKMKSREGTVVDADDLLDRLEELALDGLRERGRLQEGQDSKENGAENSENSEVGLNTARSIALGALHFYLLQFNPRREISFDPKESLAFTGNTGSYLQYVGARIYSILRKAGAEVEANADRLAKYDPETWSLLAGGASDHAESSANSPEWELLKQLREYPKAVSLAAAELNPSHVVKALAEVARRFSRFYHDVPILSSEEPLLSVRLDLCRATLQVLRNGMELCVIPFLESM